MTDTSKPDAAGQCTPNLGGLAGSSPAPGPAGPSADRRALAAGSAPCDDAGAASRPVDCEIRVAGHLDDRWSDWLEGLTVHRNDDATTTIAGSVADQARLHGVLAALRDLGVTLLELRLSAAGRLQRYPWAHAGQDGDAWRRDGRPPGPP